MKETYLTHTVYLSVFLPPLAGLWQVVSMYLHLVLKFFSSVDLLSAT